jgi:hypothetical protein
METKVCIKCKAEKPVCEFSYNNKERGILETRCKQCIFIYHHGRIDRIPENVRINKRNYDRNRRYGVTKQEYESLLIKQEHRCAICGKEENNIYRGDKKLINLSVDHDHNTGKVRGLLCRTCNIAVGNAKENPDILRAAANYLESYII